MTAFAELVATRTDLAGEDVIHLQRLVASWRPLADLSFSDVLLLAPIAREEGHRYVVLAQVRPVTGQTVYPVDLVGEIVDEVERPLLARAWRSGEITQGEVEGIGTRERARVQAIPIRHAGRVVALATRESPIAFNRRSGELERTYLETFDRIATMIAEGAFPYPVDEVEIESAPRVGDGVLLIDAELRILFASPNAVSSFHRLGIHSYAQGHRLRDVGFDDRATRVALATRLPVAEEVERGEVSVLLRVMPLLAGDRATGAICLVRDVTDLRRRDRMLISKDATIREIHHRVKNNLQTIASLLRLQSRRLRSDEAREALEESERRIRAIAIVHETLARHPGEVVHFSTLLRPLVRVVEETVSSDDVDIRFSVDGDAGELPGEVATPLAVVLNELMQNAVDHAFPAREGRREGHVRIHLDRVDDRVRIDVVDDGVGLPERFALESSAGLGLSIVRALVAGELGGSLEMRNDGGTAVHLEVPLAVPRVEL